MQGICTLVVQQAKLLISKMIHASPEDIEQNYFMYRNILGHLNSITTMRTNYSQQFSYFKLVWRERLPALHFLVSSEHLPFP